MEPDYDEYLEHHGVKGMKWGVRNTPVPGVSRRTNREARKDASEHARAKMYYGDGAGNRRKLINKSVEDKKKRDPNYAKAFDHYADKQNIATHAEKARRERTRTDQKTRNKQRRGAIARRITGSQGTQAAYVALAAGGVTYIKSPTGQRHIKSTMQKAKSQVAYKAGEKYVSDYLRSRTSR